jgi:hypothetical protein
MRQMSLFARRLNTIGMPAKEYMVFDTEPALDRK